MNVQRLVLIAALSTASAFGQTPAASFQNATLTGAGNAITASWIPVTTSKGVVYVNLTLQFNADDSGNITVADGFPQQAPSPMPLVTAFMPGTYDGPGTINGGKSQITIAGPGATAGGVTIWTLATPAGASIGTYPTTAAWYTGPIANSPIAARLAKATINSPFYTYGTSGTITCGCTNSWVSGGIIGVSQVGNVLTIVSFTNTSGDQSQPVDQITYTLKTQ
jgi:hypothetical protein